MLRGGLTVVGWLLVWLGGGGTFLTVLIVGAFLLDGGDGLDGAFALGFAGASAAVLTLGAAILVYVRRRLRPAADPPRPPSASRRPLLTRLRRSGVFFALEVAVVLVTIVAFWIDYIDRSVEREAQSWSVLAIKASGNSGKVPALEYLKRRQADLSGLNLSCDANDGLWDAERLTCQRRPFFDGLDLSPGFWNRRVRIVNSDFSGATFQGADLSRANAAGVRFIGAQMYRTRFVGAELTDTRFDWSSLIEADFSGASMIGTVMRDADLRRARFVGAEMTGTDFAGANVSGADFTRAEMRPGDIAGAWYWSDAPPRGLGRSAEAVPACPAALQDAYYGPVFRGHFSARQRGLPEGCGAAPGPRRGARDHSAQ